MKHSMDASELDRMFDDGEDITPYLDFDLATRPNLEPRRVNVDFPLWMVESLDREATRLGIPRQSVIKIWIGERLEANATQRVRVKAERAALAREARAMYGSKVASEDTSEPSAG